MIINIHHSLRNEPAPRVLLVFFDLEKKNAEEVTNALQSATQDVGLFLGFKKCAPPVCVCVCVYATCPWLSRTPPPPPPDYDLPSKQAPVSLIPSHPSDSLPSQP